MAIVTTHTLNSVDGSHAGGIAVSILRIEKNSERTPLFSGATDEGGRLSVAIDAEDIARDCAYEMVLQTGEYFQQMQMQMQMQLPESEVRIQKEIVIRFEMPDADGKYHMPMMLAPNSYSVWFSG